MQASMTNNQGIRSIPDPSLADLVAVQVARAQDIAAPENDPQASIVRERNPQFEANMVLLMQLVRQALQDAQEGEQDCPPLGQSLVD